MRSHSSKVAADNGCAEDILVVSLLACQQGVYQMHRLHLIWMLRQIAAVLPTCVINRHIWHKFMLNFRCERHMQSRLQNGQCMNRARIKT
jgi:hypothetical protein